MGHGRLNAVRLRAVEAQDSPALLAWRNSPEVAAYMYADHLISQDEHDRWFAAAMVAPDRRYWIIEADGQRVGLANLTKIDETARRCDWAYYLGDPATRGKGLGAQVEYIVLRHVFETLGLNKLWCEVLAENKAVIRLHERFGFVAEARFREHVLKGGRFQDVLGMGLLKREWTAARPQIEARLKALGIDARSLPPAG
jgi:UDP-4-amino-4,6-dideoxy-N-acetyl-beta-L-altrosamine N-acetyltransferase